MVLSQLRDWVELSSEGLHKAGYQSIWSGLFVTSFGAISTLVFITIIGIVQLEMFNVDNAYVKFLEGHILASVIALVFIYPALLIFKKITQKARLEFEFDSIPADFGFGFLLVISGAAYWYTFAFLLSDVLTSTGEEISILLGLIATFAGVTVTSTGAIIVGATRLVVAIHLLSVERLFPWILSQIKRLTKPIYLRYRLLVCLGFLLDKTLLQTFLHIRRQGLDETIDQVLESS